MEFDEAAAAAAAAAALGQTARVDTTGVWVGDRVLCTWDAFNWWWALYIGRWHSDIVHEVADHYRAWRAQGDG